MKVKEVIEMLKKQDPEDEVLCYNQSEEAYNCVELIEVHNEENYRYVKADNPFEKDYGTYDRAVVLLGYMALDEV